MFTFTLLLPFVLSGNRFVKGVFNLDTLLKTINVLGEFFESVLARVIIVLQHVLVVLDGFGIVNDLDEVIVWQWFHRCRGFRDWKVLQVLV